MDEPNNKVKTDKLTDKAFLRLVVTSIIGILVCIVCLCSTTYAWFTESVPSIGNEIRASGECTLEVTVSPHNPEGAALTDIENGVELDENVEYLVVLLLPPKSASGYCVIEAGGNNYYSDYLMGNSDQPQIKAFKLRVYTTQAVKFTTRWGIYNRNSDVVDGVLTIASENTLNGSEFADPNENISE